jgi:hypothetical protein
MIQVTYMHDVMNSNNILSLSSVLLLGMIFVVTLGIGEQMAKAGLANDNYNWICWPEKKYTKNSSSSKYSSANNNT